MSSTASPWGISANPARIQFPVTEVGAVSPPQTVEVTNTGSAPIEIASLDLVLHGGVAQDALPGEFELQGGDAGALHPGRKTSVSIVFRPIRALAHVGAKLRIRGIDSKQQLNVPLKATSTPAIAEHADQAELSNAAYEARYLETAGTAPRVERYSDMLGAVLAAGTVTAQARPGDGTTYVRVRRLLAPVAERLDQLNDHQGRLERFGAGNLAGQVVLDTSQAAIRSWLHLLQLGASINTDELVRKFRMGAEPLRFLTGERGDAPTLRAFDRASKATALGASAIVLLPGVAAVVAAEAPLVAATTSIAARRVTLWALTHPAAALAASEALLGFGVQVGEDGWERFWDQLRDPEGCWFVLAQVLMDYMHVRGGMVPHGSAPQGDSSSPEPRRRAQQFRAVLQDVRDQATEPDETTDDRPAGPRSNRDSSVRQGRPQQGEPTQVAAPASAVTAAGPQTTDGVYAAAIAELEQIPVARLPAGTLIFSDTEPLHHDTYYVSPEAAEHMLRCLVQLEPSVQTRAYPKGFVIRREGDEWYFEIHDTSHALTVHDGQRQGGLPPANAATIELWGFRGVRTIDGRPKSEWTAEELRTVEEYRQTEPLIYAGHVGISVDGGKTIYGFTPQHDHEISPNAMIASLMAHDAYPGVVKDDTEIFRLAEKLATRRGWNTKPFSSVELVHAPHKLEVIGELERMSGMPAGVHGLGYSFPLEQPSDGQHFNASNGFDCERIGNCATFPSKIGVSIPEPSGNLRQYMPELEKWASADKPVDSRKKAKP